MSNPLRILQVCSARNIVYGAVRSMITLSDALRANGHIVEYLTFEGRGAGPALRSRGETVHEVRVRAKMDPVAIARMADVMRKRKIQVVHTHLSTSSLNGALAARFAGLPAVATVHGMSGKLSFSFAHQLIAVSEQVKHHLVGQGVSPDRIKVIYNGIQMAELQPGTGAQVRSALDITTSFPVVGTVARVTALKGVAYAIEAMAGLRSEYPNLAYIILGDGDGVEACKALTTRLKLDRHVQFLGYRTPVEPYLQAMDVLAFPSLKEAMGIALVEAAAQGVPIVATNVGGIPEVVTPDLGILVPPADAVAMADALRQICANDDRRASMGNAGRKRALALFSSSAMADTTEALYRDILRKKGQLTVVEDSISKPLSQEL